MNYTLAASLLVLFSINAHGQDLAEADVPAAVKSAFTTKFPKAQGAKWEMEDKKDYEAEFKEDGTKRSATFDAEGKWKATETGMKVELLPEAVRKVLASDYASAKTEEAETVETPEGTFYEVELKKGEQTIEVLFSADGKVISSKMEEEDEKGEDKDDDKD